MDIVKADSPTLTSFIGAIIVDIVKADSPTLISRSNHSGHCEG